MKKYGVSIKNVNQPLIKVLADKKFSKKNEEKKYIYLIPEMTCLTGLTDDQRKDFRVMKSLGEFTKLSANKRMRETVRMLDYIAEDPNLMYEINKKPKAIKGYKLRSPEILAGKNKVIEVVNGSIRLKQRVLEPYNFKNLYFCYSVGQNPNDDRDDSDIAYEYFKTASIIYGIEFSH